MNSPWFWWIAALPVGNAGGQLLAGLEVEHDRAALLGDHPVVAVEDARILGDRIEGDAERGERLAVHAVAVRRGDHVGPSLVDGRVDHERGAVDRLRRRRRRRRCG